MSENVIQAIRTNVESAVLGKQETVRLAVIALLAGGHVLLEDAPGLGKTSLARALAKTLGCQFNRLQFTPDLLPSDIVGANVYRPNSGDFEFRPGPVFTNILLADEINRTTPRTQSALLEAMSEEQVSIEGETLPLPQPFLVLATQNPFEFEGTYPLPENQLDRFMVCLELGYPDRETEREVFRRHRDGEPTDALEAVTSADQITELQKQVTQVRVDDSISDYMLDVVEASRNHPELALGVSTRGALTLYRAAQAMALVEERDFVIPDDVKQLITPVLAHRIVCRGALRDGHRRRASQILTSITDNLAVPK
ncbi:AAA family ATPase [Fuerstiella marisgermanici]|uniref:Magnesium-chelatase 38 kDa subunit n=1 Tax=Fuerstiella marisgermanici TaxID=1891926 RepID=A0A1P8WD69_9PLAN|nr:MoxR family ATPase [Fuerstiella marisgermanici]APZ92000.1 Magnesium-chelatase 38 kDa subunit [Fuerstiella marisgermanici]